MGLDVFKTKNEGMVRIDSDIAEKLMEFEAMGVNVCISKKDLKELIDTEDDKNRKEIYKEILSLFKKGEEFIDLTIS